MPRTFDNLILIGRPACGKSEFIDFMKKLTPAERAEKFHIGNLSEMDDFVWLWEKFVEDDIWQEMGLPRKYSGISEHAYVVTSSELLEFMFHKFNHAIAKDFLAKPEFYKDGTLFIEFSRGSLNDGGYKKALNILSKEVLERSAILYINVSYDESQRRNTKRYQEKLKHSVLAHKVPDADMVRFSSKQDWEELTSGKLSGYLTLHGINVPFVTMNNEPELPAGAEIGERYRSALNELFSKMSF